MSAPLTLLMAVMAIGIAQAGQKNQKAKDLIEDKALITAPSTDWIKTYSLSPYSEYWTLDVAVKNIDKDLPKILKLFETGQAVLTQPLAQFPASRGAQKTQQLSYQLSERAAQDVLGNLRKTFAVAQPRIMHNGELVNIAEIKNKLGKLTAERNGHRQELAGMPSIAAMTDEMIQHLSIVKQVRENVSTQALLNITIQEKQ